VPAHHPYVNLTWTVMAADLDLRKLKRGQLCNHFSPTGHLTTKVSRTLGSPLTLALALALPLDLALALILTLTLTLTYP
jgi:hypothetical protein